MKRRKEGTTRRKSAKKRQLGKYKSGLEKSGADLLKEAKLAFNYEEKEYILVDKFSRTLKFEKINDFSRMSDDS